MHHNLQPEHLQQIVAQNIRARRTQLALTQSDLAARINSRRARTEPQAHQTHIAALENGARTPSIATLAELATALDTHPHLLLRPQAPPITA